MDTNIVYGGLVAAITALSGYIVKQANERTAREREIATLEREAREKADARAEAIATARRTEEQEAITATLQEIVKGQQVIEANIGLIAREYATRRRPATTRKA